MSISGFFRNVFYKLAGGQTVRLDEPVQVSPATKVAVEEMAIFSCVNLLSGIIAKCEFKTYQSREPVQLEEYYLWNVEPNRNQNSVQLIQEFVARLLLCNEALMVEVGGQLLVAESYQRTQSALTDDAFTGVTCRGLTFRKPFLMSDVIFLTLNNTDIQFSLQGLYTLYGEAIAEAFDKYQKSGGKSGILHISGSARGAPSFEKDLQKLLSERFKTFFLSKNAVLPLFDGYEYTPQSTEAARKTTNEVNDIRTLTAQAMERAANAYKIAPQLLRGDVTNIDDAINATLTFAVDPILRQLEVELIRKRYGCKALLRGDYLKIDSTRIKHVDIFEIADKADKLIAARLYNTNEIREKIGDQRINKPWADEYLQTKNYDSINAGGGAVKGGENDVVTV